MRKNVSGQVIAAQLVSATDGSNVTSGTTTVYVTGDGGTQSTGGGTVTHEGQGCWSYAPTQAETNYNHVAYTFVNSSAVSATVQVYPVAYDPSDAAGLGLSRLDAAVSSRLATAGYTAPLDSAGTATAVWNAATATYGSAGSYGLLLETNIDATISSRLSSAGYTAPPSSATIADAVWDEALSGHLSAGSTGNALNAAGSAGDPWSTSLPGAYGAGSAGYLIGTYVDAAISSRLATSGYTTPPTSGAIADAVWDEAISGHLSAGSTGNALNAAGSAGDPWSTPLPGAYGSGTAGKIIGDNLNATVSSRLASASYTAPLDAAGTAGAVWNAATASYGSAGTYGALIETNLDAAITSRQATLDATARDAIADAILKRDFSSVTGEASRSAINALRFLRNKWSISGTTMTVTKEDDSTSAWTAVLTTSSSADPVTGVDPA